MPSRSVGPSPRGGIERLGIPVSAAEWRLLTRLPGRVAAAATAVEAAVPGVFGSAPTVVNSARRAVTSTLAGLDGIAAGRAFDSDLVRAVVATIYAESEADDPAGAVPTDPGSLLAEVVASCRSAVALLARADPADSAAYRQWVQSIAVRIQHAAAPYPEIRLDAASSSLAGCEFARVLREALALG